MPGSRAVDPMPSIFFKSLFKPPIFRFLTKFFYETLSLYFDAEILLQHDFLM